MNRPPAFQFYPKDWMDFKVQRMSYEAQGIYMKMLCFMWNDSRDQCSMPNDDIIISKSLGITQKRWIKIREEIFYKNDPIFKINGNKIISKRLKKEVKKLREYRRIQAEKGRKSALSRGTTVKPRLNHSATEGVTERQPKGNSSSSSSSSSLYNNKENIYSIIKHWNSQKIKTLEDRETNIRKKTLPKIQKQLKDYSVEEISEAISNYSIILKEDKYFFSYSWQLWEFLDRGLVNFLTKNEPFKNYLSEKGNGSASEKKRKKDLNDWVKKPVEE